MAPHTIPFGRSGGGTSNSQNPLKNETDYGKYHFSFELRNVLIIRSYTPLLSELVDMICEEFESCKIDILQVQGSAPVELNDKANIGTIYVGDSKKGFFYRHLPWHIELFKEKKYDAVFLLYGVDRDTSLNYNLDLYGICTPARYCIVRDINGKYRILDAIAFTKRTFFFLCSRVVLLINLWMTLLMMISILFFAILFSPLTLFHSRRKS